MLTNRFVKKYLRFAKVIGEDQNPCYSRKIGVVLVRVYRRGASRIVGTGYNGPPRNTPHCDTFQYLEKIVWPQLTAEEKRYALAQVPAAYPEQLMHHDESQKETFTRGLAGCGRCPRKVVGAASGQRLELCSCEHAEKNAVTNAGCDLHGAWAFCWCGVACWDCAKLMINAGIERAYFVDDGSYGNGQGQDYSFGSRWLFEQAGVEIKVMKPEDVLS